MIDPMPIPYMLSYKVCGPLAGSGGSCIKGVPVVRKTHFSLMPENANNYKNAMVKVLRTDYK